MQNWDAPDAYNHKGELDQAFKYLEQAQTLTSVPNNIQSFTVSSFYHQGEFQSYERRDVQRIKMFQEYWPRMKFRAELNETLGETFLGRQEYQQAALAFRQALFEFPLSTRASLGLAKALMAQNKDGGSIAVLKRYLKFNPRSVEAQELLQEVGLAT